MKMLFALMESPITLSNKIISLERKSMRLGVYKISN